MHRIFVGHAVHDVPCKRSVTLKSVMHSMTYGSLFAYCVFDLIEFQPVRHLISTRPVHRINTRINPTMKTGPLPVLRAFNETVFHRIVVNVIEVAFKIVIFLDRVLPEPRLPNPGATLAAAGS